MFMNYFFKILNQSNASMYSQIIAARKYDNVGPA